MAKYHISRVQKKYRYSGMSYQELMARIIAHNTDQINTSVARRANADVTATAKKYKEGTVKVPAFAEALDSRQVHFRKAAEKGDIISGTLRDALAEKLREALQDPSVIQAKGRTAGEIKQATMKAFKASVKDVFIEYTQRTGRMEMPTNITTIAETELRSSVSAISEAYMQKVAEQNPNVRLFKTWIHDRRLSKPGRFRTGHKKINGMRIPSDQPFPVPGKSGVIILMKHPHDPDAPAEEVINCHCRLRYTFERIK